MYKTYYEPDKSDLFHPHKKGKKVIWVTEIGTNKPPQSYDSQVMSKNAFVLQYVRSGKGCYNDQKIEAPCLLLMIPDSQQRYTVDEDSPAFEQYWIQFCGSNVRELLEEIGFPIENAVFPCPYINQAWQVLKNMTSKYTYVGLDERYMMLSGLFRLFALHSNYLQQESLKGKRHPSTETILEYFRSNYASPITEQELAALVHLSVNYMHRLFYKDMGVPPIHYLNLVRIRRAKNLLKETNLPISTIAEHVGFSSGNYFSRLFQKYNHNISPSEYRKNNV